MSKKITTNNSNFETKSLKISKIIQKSKLANTELKNDVENDKFDFLKIRVKNKILIVF